MQRLISDAERNAAPGGNINREDKKEIYLLKSRFGDGQKKMANIMPFEEAYARYIYASANPRENGLNYSPAADPNGYLYMTTTETILKSCYFIPEIGSMVYLSYDREGHNLSGLTQPFKPVQNAVTL